MYKIYALQLHCDVSDERRYNELLLQIIIRRYDIYFIKLN